MNAGLGKTLMERIVENKPEVVTLLNIQYRMNEQIMRFPSEYFYNGEVETAPQIKYRGILDFDNPIEWRDTKELVPLQNTDKQEYLSKSNTETIVPHEEYVGENFGRINKAEAKYTINTLKEYFTKIGKQRILDEQIDVGVISPYRAQVQYLRKIIKSNDFFKPFHNLITVNTVDGFQGQERDIILISMVRDNANGEIGFLRDLRRMNVAITRARMKLIILGDKDTLSSHPFYKKLWNYIQKINNNVTA